MQTNFRNKAAVRVGAVGLACREATILASTFATKALLSRTEGFGYRVLASHASDDGAPPLIPDRYFWKPSPAAFLLLVFGLSPASSPCRDWFLFLMLLARMGLELPHAGVVPSLLHASSKFTADTVEKVAPLMQATPHPSWKDIRLVLGDARRELWQFSNATSLIVACDWSHSAIELIAGGAISMAMLQTHQLLFALLIPITLVRPCKSFITHLQAFAAISQEFSALQKDILLSDDSMDLEEGVQYTIILQQFALAPIGLALFGVLIDHRLIVSAVVAAATVFVSMMSRVIFMMVHSGQHAAPQS